MSQLDQLQITFSALEDRLLLRLSTQSAQEFRFWLTRRFVQGLLPLLQQSLSAHPRIQTQADPLAKLELLRFEHERALQNSDFKTPFKGVARSLPLGEQPVLLSRCEVRPRPDGAVVMVVAPEQGSGIDLALNPSLLHSIVALIEQALRAADWDLKLDIPTPAAAAGPVSIN